MENRGPFLMDAALPAAQGKRSRTPRMPPISRHWKVDRIHCHLLGQGFAGLGLEPKVHPLRLLRPWQVWTELLTVTVCHQANWDKLHAIVMDLAATKPSQIDPRHLAHMSGSDFREMFGGAYDTDRIRTAERARLLRATANAVETDTDGPRFDWLPAGSVRLCGCSGSLRSATANRGVSGRSSAKEITHSRARPPSSMS